MKNELQNGVLVISLEGNLLGETINAPVMDLIKKNQDEGNKKVLFDLEKVNFINSTGLGMLLTAVSKTRNAGGEMALCCLPDQMKKLLQITKLESVFIVYTDVPTAITSLNKA